MTAEVVIERYLLALKDPSVLVDRKAIEELEAQLARAEHPIERVLLRADIDAARNVTAATFEEEFIAVAKAWAQEHGVSASAFEEEGVPAPVLRRAGIAASVSRGRPRKVAEEDQPRRKRTSTEEIAAALPDGPFSLRDATEAAGASAAPVRSVINRGLADGTIREIGPDPAYSGYGRAPNRFARVPPGGATPFGAAPETGRDTAPDIASA